MALEVVRSPARLRELEPEWSGLHRRAGNAAPFLHPAWLLPWWDFSGSGELLCVALHAGGRLTGLAPLFLHEWEGRRQVTLLGTGVSDRLGLLAEAAHQPALGEAVARVLAAEKDRWDLCDFQDLGSDCGLPCWEGLQLSREPQCVCAEAALPAGADEWLDGLPHGLRRNLRRYREKLEAAGDARFEQPPAPEGMDDLLRLHTARWNGRGESGMLAGAAGRFHRAAVDGMTAIGMARCFRISLDGRPAAVLYGFRTGARFWSYQTGFDPALAAFSPGSLVLEHAITSLIAEGVSEFDFLRGDEEYKRQWGAQPYHSYRLRIRPA